jgi:hypothetical protein
MVVRTLQEAVIRKASRVVSTLYTRKVCGARAIQASRGNALKDGTSWLTFSNMKTFMTPDAPYRSAPRTCKTHNRTLIVCFLRYGHIEAVIAW